VSSILKTVFLIDGFNLYHSAKDASRNLRLSGKGTKWLNIHSLCSAYLHLIDPNARLERIYYFSAYAHHLQQFSPGTVQRHQQYVACLEDTGVTVEMGRFKKKYIDCTSCGHTMLRHEEKETDVAMSLKLLEIFISGEADIAVMVTGDTDCAPSIRIAHQLFPGKKIGVAFPHNRKNRDLVNLADFSFNMSGKNYRNYQFTDPYTLADGRQIQKPARW
jgi:uncharacterized LabA/DUF88 family protein